MVVFLLAAPKAYSIIRDSAELHPAARFGLRRVGCDRAVDHTPKPLGGQPWRHKSNVTGHTQLHFRSRRVATDKLEGRSDPLRSLPHPRQSPMSDSACLQYVLVDPTAVVAHKYAQLTGGIMEFHPDPGGPGVAERIDHGFSPDGIDFIANDRMQ